MKSCGEKGTVDTMHIGGIEVSVPAVQVYAGSSGAVASKENNIPSKQQVEIL